MDDVEVEFIERFGLMSEEDGLPRIAGRIYGLLLLCGGPLTLDDIAERLQVSKTSVSTNTRLLDRLGAVERTSKPGDRRAFYRISPEAVGGHFDRIKERMNEVLRILEETIPRLDEEKCEARQRLAMMRDWHLFLLREMDDLVQRWKQERQQEGSEP